ncbi:flagellar biosynthetic protein FliR [Desulfonauticus submarinus]|uniref:Flagellar biosynthetic protein FliR n=1 Tax=Desulfonauticus submarinus TaxID=206665 RepID=A0A1H0B5Q6_9BACT|nr:flagellar biosynthetic protein FliR [Desulfonauticus submarinus]SDN40976.1 flagellar biosynthetic protein FliR [Desulfonauticus submarinus]
MNLFNFSPDTILSFFLTLFRVSIILFFLPFFGAGAIPNKIKVMICLTLSFALWPYLNFPAHYFPAHPLNICLMIFGEALLGLTLGLIIHFLFAAIQTGGQLVGFQMGFAMINVIDPITGVSEAVTAHFLYMVSILAFLSLNGHLFILRGLAESFKFIPPGQVFFSPFLVKNMLYFSSQIFVLAIKIAAPVMAALFLIDLALALISRAAPQMNVLFVGFPLKIIVGFLFLGFLFEIMVLYMQDFILHLDKYFSIILKGIH